MLLFRTNGGVYWVEPLPYLFITIPKTLGKPQLEELEVHQGSQSMSTIIDLSLDNRRWNQNRKYLKQDPLLFRERVDSTDSMSISSTS